MDRKTKLLEAKRKLAKQAPEFKVDFINTNEVYKQLDTIYTRIEENNQVTKDLVKDALDVVGEVLSDLQDGVNIKNVEDITVEVSVPDVNVPEIKVPEVKMPTINVPEPTVIQEQGLFSKYTPADIVKDGSTTYYGYLAKSGEWLIMRETTTKNTTKYRYSSGTNSFGKAFSSRARLDYKYLDEVL